MKAGISITRYGTFVKGAIDRKQHKTKEIPALCQVSGRLSRRRSGMHSTGPPARRLPAGWAQSGQAAGATERECRYGSGIRCRCGRSCCPTHKFHRRHPADEGPAARWHAACGDRWCRSGCRDLSAGIARTVPPAADGMGAAPDGPVQGKEYLAHLGEAFRGHGLTAHARAHLVQVGQLTVVCQAQKRLEGDVRFQRSRRRNGMCRNPAFGQGFKPHLARRFQERFSSSSILTFKRVSAADGRR